MSGRAWKRRGGLSWVVLSGRRGRRRDAGAADAEERAGGARAVGRARGRPVQAGRGAAGEAQDGAGDIFDKGRDYFEEQAQRLTSAFEAGRTAMKDEITRGRSCNALRWRRSSFPSPKSCTSRPGGSVLPAGRAGHRHLRGSPGRRGPRRQPRDEGDDAVPAEVVRPVGVLPGQGDPRAPVPGAGAAVGGRPVERGDTVKPEARDKLEGAARRSLEEEEKRYGVGEEDIEKGRRSSSTSGTACGPRSVLPLRGSAVADRHRDGLCLDSGGLRK